MGNGFRLRALILSAGIALGGPGLGQNADDDDQAAADFDRAPVSCVSMRQIQNTEIVDDRTILFYRRGGQIYVNLLEDDCPTLKRNNLFRYRVQSSIRTARLCDFDAISVVDRLTNSLSYTCRLGPFYPVEAEQAQLLLQASAQAVTLEPLELPEEETGGETPAEPPNGTSAETSAPAPDESPAETPGEPPR